MSELDELYQDVIIDHSRRPRNFGILEGATRKADGHNPLCGDQITVYLNLEHDVIRDIRFEGSGCALSTASASMMTASVKSKTRAEAERLFERFHGMITAEQGDGLDPSTLGKLAVFSGVREFPLRVKCVSLPWHTLRAGLDGTGQPVSTEEGFMEAPKEERPA